MAKHNKKRNVGLLHEQLVRYASEMTVEGNEKSAEKSLSILIEYFNKDSALFSEFRLFSALAHPVVPNKEIARRIIEESRRACKAHDPHKLNKEKSKLIREINHEINQSNFYNQRIPDYKIFSTIQALLNEWRGKNILSPDERVQYELFLESHLTRSSSKSSLNKQDNADPLILNIMIEKFNKKYGKSLTKPQKSLLEAKLEGQKEAIIKQSNLIKLEAKKSIEEFYSTCKNDFLISKREILENKVDNYFPNHSDESITKALMLSDLINELEDKNV